MSTYYIIYVIKRSSRFPGENQRSKSISRGESNDQSHLLTIHVRMQWAGPGFGRVGGANEAGVPE